VKLIGLGARARAPSACPLPRAAGAPARRPRVRARSGSPAAAAVYLLGFRRLLCALPLALARRCRGARGRAVVPTTSSQTAVISRYQ